MTKLTGFSGASEKGSVKIEFNRLAMNQCRLISILKTKVTGFILGSRMGNYTIIENFYFFRLNSGNLSHLYPIFLKQFGERFLGVFFMNTDYFLNDWFLENIIIRFNRRNFSVFWYHLDQVSQKKMLKKIFSRRGSNG